MRTGHRGQQSRYLRHDGVAERGSSGFAVKDGGARLHLASTEQAARPDTDPQPDVPLFGAVCAYNPNLGRATPIDPTSFRMVDRPLLPVRFDATGDPSPVERQAG